MPASLPSASPTGLPPASDIMKGDQLVTNHCDRAPVPTSRITPRISHTRIGQRENWVVSHHQRRHCLFTEALDSHRCLDQRKVAGREAAHDASFRRPFIPEADFHSRPRCRSHSQSSRPAHPDLQKSRCQARWVRRGYPQPSAPHQSARIAMS